MQRLPEKGGIAQCVICRKTSVDARRLTPSSAYALNYNVMEMCDVLGLQAECRPCSLTFSSQAQLLRHYSHECPAAVVACRYAPAGCCYAERRGASLEQHEQRCLAGRTTCRQCGEWVDRLALVRHMAAECHNRTAECVLCHHTAPLPQMLHHLQHHLQRRASLSGGAGGAGAVEDAARQSVAVTASERQLVQQQLLQQRLLLQQLPMQRHESTARAPEQTAALAARPVQASAQPAPQARASRVGSARAAAGAAACTHGKGRGSALVAGVRSMIMRAAGTSSGRRQVAEAAPQAAAAAQEAR